MRNEIKRRKNRAKRERIVMIASSVCLLGAVAFTAINVRNNNSKTDTQGYELNFTANENSVRDKADEIGNNLNNAAVYEKTQNEVAIKQDEDSYLSMDSDLDYQPVEADSHAVEIGKVTIDNRDINEREKDGQISEDLWDELDVIEDGDDIANKVSSLSFSEAAGLKKPIEKSILMHYSPDKSIYFKTLDQYKPNPAVIFSAAEGDAVYACASGVVTDICDDTYLGKTLTMDLGNGYVVKYGQLKDLRVSIGDDVEEGAEIGYIAHSSIYYNLEGDNLYFEMTNNGKYINPETLFR